MFQWLVISIFHSTKQTRLVECLHGAKIYPHLRDSEPKSRCKEPKAEYWPLTGFYTTLATAVTHNIGRFDHHLGPLPNSDPIPLEFTTPLSSFNAHEKTDI